MSASEPTLKEKNVQIIRRGDTEIIDVLGVHMEWKITEYDTGHHYCVFEMTVGPGALVPLHHHAPQETFLVLEGHAEFGRLASNGAEWLPVEPGDTVHVPSWAYHGFRNTSDASARVLLTCAAGLEPFFRESGIPVMPGMRQPPKPPSPADIERVTAIATKHGSYFLSRPEV